MPDRTDIPSRLEPAHPPADSRANRPGLWKSWKYRSFDMSCTTPLLINLPLRYIGLSVQGLELQRSGNMLSNATVQLSAVAGGFSWDQLGSSSSCIKLPMGPEIRALLPLFEVGV